MLLPNFPGEPSDNVSLWCVPLSSRFLYVHLNDVPTGQVKAKLQVTHHFETVYVKCKKLKKRRWCEAAQWPVPPVFIYYWRPLANYRSILKCGRGIEDGQTENYERGEKDTSSVKVKWWRNRGVGCTIILQCSEIAMWVSEWIWYFGNSLHVSCRLIRTWDVKDVLGFEY